VYSLLRIVIPEAAWMPEKREAALGRLAGPMREHALAVVVVVGLEAAYRLDMETLAMDSAQKRTLG
jgi:hypothetical protein